MLPFDRKQQNSVKKLSFNLKKKNERESSLDCKVIKSVLKEISPGCSLEGLMLKLKLKLQYFGHLVGRADWLEKILMLGKSEGRRRRVTRG